MIEINANDSSRLSFLLRLAKATKRKPATDRKATSKITQEFPKDEFRHPYYKFQSIEMAAVAAIRLDKPLSPVLAKFRV